MPPEGGIILVGVEDYGTVTGCRRVAPSHINDLERTADVHCPDAEYECKNVPIVNIASGGLTGLISEE